MTLFLEDWDVDNPLEQIASDFEISSRYVEEVNIIVAHYSYEYYTGEAFILFEKDDELFIVTGSHCSCYGLEGQWKPELIMKEYLVHLIDKGSFVYEQKHNEKIINHINDYLNKGGNK